MVLEKFTRGLEKGVKVLTLGGIAYSAQASDNLITTLDISETEKTTHVDTKGSTEIDNETYVLSDKDLATSKEVVSPTDTTRILVLTSPVKTATVPNLAEESVLPSYRKFEHAIYASQLLGAMDQSVQDYIDEIAAGGQGFLVEHNMSIDTVTNNETITTILAEGLLDETSDMHNLNNISLIKDLNPARIFFVYHGSEVEQQTIGEITGGRWIAIEDNNQTAKPDNELIGHGLGHIGEEVNNGIIEGIGHNYGEVLSEDLSIEINGELNEFEAGRGTLTYVGTKQFIATPEAAKGIVFGLKRAQNEFPHPRNEDIFIALSSEDGTITFNTDREDSDGGERDFTSWEKARKEVKITKRNIVTGEVETIYEEMIVDKNNTSGTVSSEPGTYEIQVRYSLVNNEFWVNTDTVVVDQIMSATESLDEENISLFLNPTTDKLHIQLPASLHHEVISYTITSILGQKMKKGNIENGVDLDISELQSGTYALTLQTGGEIVTKKFSK